MQKQSSSSITSVHPFRPKLLLAKSFTDFQSFIKKRSIFQSPTRRRRDRGWLRRDAERVSRPPGNQAPPRSAAIRREVSSGLHIFGASYLDVDMRRIALAHTRTFPVDKSTSCVLRISVAERSLGAHTESLYLAECMICVLKDWQSMESKTFH